MTILAAYRWPTNGHLIEHVASLGLIRTDDRILDPTYGDGVWWRQWKPEALTVRSDVTTPEFDFRALPFGDGTFDVVAFDPPYVLKGGRKSSGIKSFDRHFGLDKVPSTYPELRALIDGGLDEAYRVLDDPRFERVNGKRRLVGGVCLFKCKNFIWSSKFYAAAHDGLDHARSIGFELVQEFVMLASGPQPERTRADGYPALQENARNNYSTLYVLRRPRREEAVA